MVSAFNKFTHVFWNREEQRLRAAWRLGLHTALLFLIASFFTVVLIFISVNLDLASETNIQQILTGTSVIALTETLWVNLIVLPLASFLGVLSATYLVGRYVDRRPFRKFGLFFSAGWWGDFSFGLGLGAVLMGLVFLAGWLTGSLRVTGYFQVYHQDISFFGGLIRALFFFVLVGIYEELLFRGYHLVNLAEGFNGRWIGERGALGLAYLVSSLVFGVLHLGNPNATWVSAVNVSLAGAFLGLGMVLTGSLAIPIGLHITWNFFQGNVFGFAVSGINTGATVIATEATGPAWLTGGSFGPEGGLLGLGAMLVGCVLILLWVRRKGNLSLAEDLTVYDPRISHSDHQMQSSTPNQDTD